MTTLPVTGKRLLLAIPVAAALAVPAGAQIPDARVLPRGALRISFSPVYTNYDSRFSLGTPGLDDGSEEPLGSDLSAPALGSNLLPSLIGARDAVRAITGDAAFEFNLGALTTDLDGDIRVFPFDIAVGLSDRLSMNVRLPIVTARMNAAFVVDSSTAEAGFNTLPADAAATQLWTDVGVARDFVDMQIQTGAYGCPGTAQCDAAQASVARATSLLNSLLVLTDGANPAAPLAGSTAGTAIQAEVAAVLGELTALGAPAVGGALNLPTAPDPFDLGAVLTGTGFGYDLFPLTTVKISRFGDMEVGFRYLAVNRPALRGVLHTTLRLPTGTLDSPRHLVDIGTGDRQLDVQAGLELNYAAGARTGFSGAVDFTYQSSLTRSMRIARPDAPIALAAEEQTVTRSPGNALRASFHPWLQLGTGVQVFGTVAYYNKGTDSYSSVGTPVTTVSGATVADLGLESGNTTLSFGGGIRYRATKNGRGVEQLPIEAGLNYASAFTGSGGLTPKFNRLNLYLRLYYRLFGGNPPPAPIPETSRAPTQGR